MILRNEVALLKPQAPKIEGGLGIFGFAVLAIFLGRFFGFGVHCGLRIFRFSFWFSVFAKNTNGFSDLISDAIFGFSLFDLFEFRFLFDLSGNYAPPPISNSR